MSTQIQPAITATPLNELWVLAKLDGTLVPAIDCVGDPILAFMNEASAQKSCDAHNAEWFEEDDPCRPIRVK